MSTIGFKRIVSVVVGLALLVLCTGICAQADLSKAVVLVVDCPNAFVRSEMRQIDSENANVAPLVLNDRTLVPVRFIAESLGADVGFDEATAQVTVHMEETIPADKSLEDAAVSVSASVYEDSDVGKFPPENTLDEDMSAQSTWRADGDGAWIEYDLGASLAIESVDMAMFKGNERVYTFDILVSEDGQKWTTVHEKQTNSGQSAELENYPMNDVGGRYVRIVGHGNNTADFAEWFNVVEVKINRHAVDTVVARDIEMTLDSQTYYVNGEEKTLDVPAQTVQDRTLIPLRAMVESLGKQVFWDEKGLIVISDTPALLDSQKDAALIDSLIGSLKNGK